jgi:hypothetical protein
MNRDYANMDMKEFPVLAFERAARLEKILL